MTPEERRKLLHPRLARMFAGRRGGDAATLTYIDLRPDGTARPHRYVRGGRLNDGTAWALAAWAEIVGREPTFRVQTRRGGGDWIAVNPWRNGAESAWAWLEDTAADKLWGGPARQMLDNLSSKGVAR